MTTNFKGLLARLYVIIQRSLRRTLVLREFYGAFNSQQPLYAKQQLLRIKTKAS